METTVCQEAKEIKDQLEEMNQSIDTLASSSAATNLLEAAVRHEAKEIKDQLGEMNQSIDTLASSIAAKQSSRGEFLKTLFPLCSVSRELPNCCHLY